MIKTLSAYYEVFRIRITWKRNLHVESKRQISFHQSCCRNFIIFAENLNEMTILEKPITIAEINVLKDNFFGDMIKGVVDIEKGILAIDAELHCDLEQLLLEHGSNQEALWGINLYPSLDGDDFIEFDSLINIRPWQGNRSRDVEDEMTRKAIIEIVNKNIIK